MKCNTFSFVAGKFEQCNKAADSIVSGMPVCASHAEEIRKQRDVIEQRQTEAFRESMNSNSDGL
jgi:hypothetical protein